MNGRQGGAARPSASAPNANAQNTVCTASYRASARLPNTVYSPYVRPEPRPNASAAAVMVLPPSAREAAAPVTRNTPTSTVPSATSWSRVTRWSPAARARSTTNAGAV